MIRDALLKVVGGHDLSEKEMGQVMTQIMDGQTDPILLGAFLTGLRIKGEKVDEIIGAAKVMREKAVTLDISIDPILDTCGTGGDGGNTFNISTAAAFVVAGAGITVAKHGNRAVSSRSQIRCEVSTLISPSTTRWNSTNEMRPAMRVRISCASMAPSASAPQSSHCMFRKGYIKASR